MQITRRQTSHLIVFLLALSGATLSCSASPVETRPDAVAAVVVSPEAMTLQLGRREQFQATVLDVNGETRNGARVFWAVEDTTVARINASGEVEARAVGTTKVAVAPASAQLQVAGTLALQATARDAWGGLITGRSYSWTTSNAQRATVTSGGVVTGRGPGTVSISATTGGVTGSSTITVVFAPVASVTVQPSAANMLRSQQLQLRAVLRDAAGNELAGRTVSWSSGNDRTATIDANGVVTAHRRGVVTITATSEGVSGTARINVIL